MEGLETLGRVTAESWIDGRQQNVGAIKSGFDGAQVPERSNKKSGRNEQKQRDRHLSGDEESARARPPRAAAPRNIAAELRRRFCAHHAEVQAWFRISLR